jgi:4-amino-4-deoxy-L-arabinose transferase-like glycosyltransferase
MGAPAVGGGAGTGRKASGVIGHDGPLQRPIHLAILALLVAAGFYLRLEYLRTTSPYIDEYTTMWVARRTLQHGYPVFSTGAIYAQGLLFTYLDALFFWVLGFSEQVARAPSLIISVCTIPCLYVVGKRMFSAHAGLIAAAMLAFAPQAVVWGGRARNYALIQLIVLWAVFLFYRWAIVGDGRRYGWLFVLTFVAAVFTHNVAMLLYPALLCCAFLRRGWRWFFKRGVILANAAVFVGMVGSLYLYRRLRPPGWGEVGEGRLEVGFSFNLVGAIQRYKPFFLGLEDLPFSALLTLLCALGVAYVLWRVARQRSFRALLSGEAAPLAYLGLFFFLVVLEMFFVVNERRWSPRYFFIEAPIFYLVAINTLSRAAAYVERWWREHGWLSILKEGRRRWRLETLLVAVIVALIGLVSWGPATALIAKGEYGYDRAFQYVRDNRQPDDAVMTFAISPCALYLGEEGCDYVAIEKDFHSYAIQRDGTWIEAWAGVPILFTDEDLHEVIESSPRTWFVVDESRFRTRYTREFIQYVWDRTELVAKEGGVFVFLAESPAPPPLPIQRSLDYNLGDQVALLGCGLSDTTLEPGDVLEVSLRYQGLTHILKSYSVFVHLVDAEGRLWAQHDGAPLNGLHPTTHWVEGEIISDPRELVLPQDMPEGRYQLQAGIYLPETMEHLLVQGREGQPLGETAILDYVKVERGAAGVPVPQHEVSYNFDGQVTLWGYDLTVLSGAPGGEVQVALYWRADEQMEEDYTVFVHLVDEEGVIWGQQDNEPEGGFYHMSFWDVGEMITDEYRFTIDEETPPGDYQVEVGMYLLATGERLAVVGEGGQVGDDRVVLGSIEVAR